MDGEASIRNDAEATSGATRSHLNGLRICHKSARTLLNKARSLVTDETRPQYLEAQNIYRPILCKSKMSYKENLVSDSVEYPKR